VKRWGPEKGHGGGGEKDEHFMYPALGNIWLTCLAGKVAGPTKREKEEGVQLSKGAIPSDLENKNEGSRW